MSKVIVVSNHKGGVGKTTSTINIGAALSNKKNKDNIGNKENKVLLIDLDPQANLTQSLGITDVEYNIYEALRGNQILKPISVTNSLHVVPSVLDLSGAEIELSNEAGREFILKELIQPLKSEYDYILIDSPPSLGLLTINAFTCADFLLIPVQAEFLALQGLGKLMEVLHKIKKRLNSNLQLLGVFATRYDNRKVLNRDVVDTIERHFKEKFFTTKIRDNIAIAEAPTQGEDIFRYSPKSNGSKDYKQLTKEIIKQIKNLNNE